MKRLKNLLSAINHNQSKACVDQHMIVININDKHIDAFFSPRIHVAAPDENFDFNL